MCVQLQPCVCKLYFVITYTCRGYPPFNCLQPVTSEDILFYSVQAQNHIPYNNRGPWAMGQNLRCPFANRTSGIISTRKLTANQRIDPVELNLYFQGPSSSTFYCRPYCHHFGKILVTIDLILTEIRGILCNKTITCLFKIGWYKNLLPEKLPL